jgi:phospholipase C
MRVSVDAESEGHDGIGTESPIKHVVVVIGENRSFDHIFGTYRSRVSAMGRASP